MTSEEVNEIGGRKTAYDIRGKTFPFGDSVELLIGELKRNERKLKTTNK